jgi:hypothetical protein
MANMLEIIIIVILIKVYIGLLKNTKNQLNDKIKDLNINNTKFYYLNEEIIGIPRELFEEDPNHHPILMNKSVIYSGLKRDTNLTNREYKNNI